MTEFWATEYLANRTKTASATMNALSHNAMNLGVAADHLAHGRIGSFDLSKPFHEQGAIQAAAYGIMNPYDHHTPQQIARFGDTHPVQAFLSDAVKQPERFPQMMTDAQLIGVLRDRTATKAHVAEAQYRLARHKTASFDLDTPAGFSPRGLQQEYQLHLPADSGFTDSKIFKAHQLAQQGNQDALTAVRSLQQRFPHLVQKLRPL